MRDRRENILARLVEIARGIDGVTVYRNADNPSELRLPAIDVRDGNEEAQRKYGDRIRYCFKDMVIMTPVIAIFANGNEATMAATLSRLRMTLRDAIMRDAALRVETGNNGDIRYISATTTDQWGATLHGEERIVFEFEYPFLPNDFSPAGSLAEQLDPVSLG